MEISKEKAAIVFKKEDARMRDHIVKYNIANKGHRSRYKFEPTQKKENTRPTKIHQQENSKTELDTKTTKEPKKRS